MREIKFRGRDDALIWHYGDLVTMTVGRPLIIDTVIVDNDIGEPITVAPATVGQFTGLCDSNGKEIYEGDVVDFTESMCDGDEVIIQGRGFVKYDDNTAAFVIVEDGFIPFIDIGEMSIVGNFHDNPELCEVK